MSESMVLVRLDVYQAQTVAAVLEPSSGELRVQRLRGEQASVVPAFLEELALARGKQLHDKRRDIAERDARREVARELAHVRRGR